MALIQQEGNRLVIQSAMTVATVTAVLAEVSPHIVGEVEVDLSGVESVDSSALSLLFEWMRQAGQRNATITFANLPAALVSLATLYGVLDLISQPQAVTH